MANAPYAQGTVTVGNTATLIASPGAGTGGIYLSNSSGATVFLGGANVAASGAHAGPTLAASATILLPTAGAPHDLYGITASSTSAVSYLYPVEGN